MFCFILTAQWAKEVIMAANVVFYFKSFDELESFAVSHPELWVNVLGLTAKGWYKALVSRVETNSVEPESTVPAV